jgi:hypothetical protein
MPRTHSGVALAAAVLLLLAPAARASSASAQPQDQQPPRRSTSRPSRWASRIIVDPDYEPLM